VAGLRPGQFASRKVSEAFETLPDDADGPSAVSFLTARLGTALAERGREPKAGGPMCVFVAVSAARREIWRVGDCSWMANGRAMMGTIRYAQALSEMRAGYLQSLAARGADMAQMLVKDPFSSLKAWLVASSHALINLPGDNPFAFGVINGVPVPERFIEVWRIPPGASEIVLASDGYPVLKPTLRETEAALARLLEEDPAMIGEHPQPKGRMEGWGSFDDRTFLRIGLS
jgi:hypothetical protein